MAIKPFVPFDLWVKVPIDRRASLIEEFGLNDTALTDSELNDRIEAVKKYIQETFANSPQESICISLPTNNKQIGYVVVDKNAEAVGQRKMIASDKPTTVSTNNNGASIDIAADQKKKIYLGVPGFTVSRDVFDYFLSNSGKLLVLVLDESELKSFMLKPGATVQIEFDSDNGIEPGEYIFLDDFLFKKKFQFMLFYKKASV